MSGLMARRDGAELLAGAVVLAVACGFLWYAVANTGRSIEGGYTLHAKFERIDGILVGSDVRVAGVKVGSVTAIRIDPQSYQAIVDFSVANAIKLPKDSDAVITSDGLLGGKYLSLDPGGDSTDLAPGGEITLTQSSISIEQLLGKFIVPSVSPDAQGGQKPAAGAAPPAAPK
jgi:phospholipid/cholesterol/gamma-HCH transport system substrate-binding protein